VGDRV